MGLIPKMNKLKRGDFVFKNYTVVLGLGRMATHHRKEYDIRATSKDEAEGMARVKYYKEVREEIGADAPIWGKMLTVELVREDFLKVVAE